ncbi:ABC transporter substrate-binding protein [Haloplanus pelagicus]|jgi:spermidine/putrescine-binding protein|uniref:ABC transporter substrate-binding protein n=1 Tax=Haloplanus pelagicus TaxID=2949995 RepID=UPI002040EF87|nr:extracellular solute-binding protein [Haloplanus sp. HW8-1]
MSEQDTSTNGITRRHWLAASSAAVVSGLAGCSGGGSSGDGGSGSEGTTSGGDGDGGGGTTVGTSGGAEFADTLRILMWPYYDTEELNQAFVDEYDVQLQTAYFDGNPEAYNQLRSGGAEEFDIVMADSLWPKQYYQDGLIQPVDRSRLSNLDNLVSAFHPDNLDLHVSEDGEYLGPPNAWGGYGISYNPNEVAEDDINSFMSSLYNEEYSGHIATSARMTMNVANTAMALGYNDPKGNIWDVCSEDQLQKIAELLTEQKDWLITRYSDSRNLDRLYNNGSLWLFPEFSDTFRRLAFQGNDIRHNLRPEEGGMGWLEAWMMTSGVESEAKKNAVYAFMDQRLTKNYMEMMARNVGGAPAADIRDRLTDREARIFFQDRTDQFSKLTQFGVPQCPSTWQEYWTQVQSA